MDRAHAFLLFDITQIRKPYAGPQNKKKGFTLNNTLCKLLVPCGCGCSPNCCHKDGSTHLNKMPLYAVVYSITVSHHQNKWSCV